MNIMVVQRKSGRRGKVEDGIKPSKIEYSRENIGISKPHPLEESGPGESSLLVRSNKYKCEQNRCCISPEKEELSQKEVRKPVHG